MSIDELYNNISVGQYDSSMPYPSGKRYPEDHVFDEEKSVRWNRENVAGSIEIIQLVVRVTIFCPTGAIEYDVEVVRMVGPADNTLDVPSRLGVENDPLSNVGKRDTTPLLHSLKSLRGPEQIGGPEPVQKTDGFYPAEEVEETVAGIKPLIGRVFCGTGRPTLDREGLVIAPQLHLIGIQRPLVFGMSHGNTSSKVNLLIVLV